MIPSRRGAIARSPDWSLYVARCARLGAQIVNPDLARRSIDWAKSWGLWPYIQSWCSPSFGVTKDASGYVSREVDLITNRLGGGIGDIAQATGAAQYQWLSDQQNGRPGFSYGGSQYGTIPGNLRMAQNVGGFSEIVVFRGEATATRSLVWVATNSATSRRLDIALVATNKWNVYGRRLDNDSLGSAAGDQFDSTKVQMLQADADYANAILTLYRNGSLSAQANPFQTAGNTSNTASGIITVGTNGSLSSFFLGLRFDVMLLSMVPTTAQRAAITAWFSTLYGGLG